MRWSRPLLRGRSRDEWVQLIVVPTRPFSCPNPACHRQWLAKGTPGSPLRVAVHVGLCERNDCDEREALRLIEEHPGIAAEESAASSTSDHLLADVALAALRWNGRHRMLFDVMSEWWSRHPDDRPEALLFPTATGRRRDRNNIRNRVLNPSIKLAEALLRERKSNDSFPTRERTTDSKRVTHVPTHAGRRTAITWWAEAGYDERDVMMWVGHEDPVLTLRLYRQARNRPRDPRVGAAMAEVPAKQRRAPRHLRAA